LQTAKFFRLSEDFCVVTKWIHCLKPAPWKFNITYFNLYQISSSHLRTY